MAQPVIRRTAVVFFRYSDVPLRLILRYCFRLLVELGGETTLAAASRGEVRGPQREKSTREPVD